MSKDHSLDYQKSRIFSSAQTRLKNILRYLTEEAKFENKNFADIGCSNGYITSLITQKFKINNSYGFDIDPDNIALASKRYPTIKFQILNLNHQYQSFLQYDIVTCFETLEHVGNLAIALDNLLKLKKANGLLLISVPIEIGLVGILRVIWRNIRYGYNTNVCFKEFNDFPNKEISPSRQNLFLNYMIALLTKKNISRFRQQREHWSTHFGFDYRDIDEYLQQKQLKFKAENKNMTRFYLVK